MGHVTNLHYDCVYNPYSTSISTHLEYLLRSNEIQVSFSLFSLWGTGHVKLTSKSFIFKAEAVVMTTFI